MERFGVRLRPATRVGDTFDLDVATIRDFAARNEPEEERLPLLLIWLGQPAGDPGGRDTRCYQPSVLGDRTACLGYRRAEEAPGPHGPPNDWRHPKRRRQSRLRILVVKPVAGAAAQLFPRRLARRQSTTAVRQLPSADQAPHVHGEREARFRARLASDAAGTVRRTDRRRLPSARSNPHAPCRRRMGLLHHMSCHTETPPPGIRCSVLAVVARASGRLILTPTPSSSRGRATTDAAPSSPCAMTNRRLRLLLQNTPLSSTRRRPTQCSLRPKKTNCCSRTLISATVSQRSTSCPAPLWRLVSTLGPSPASLCGTCRRPVQTTSSGQDGQDGEEGRSRLS